MVKQAIANYIQRNGIKAAYLAEKAGMSKQSICLALKGKRKLEVDEYAKICEALGVNYNFFFQQNFKTS